MKRIVVTGLECSGTKVMAGLLSQHPDLDCRHASLPTGWMPDSHLPDISDAEAVVWMIRYEPFRQKSVHRNGYDEERPPHLIGAGLMVECHSRYCGLMGKTIFVSYEGIVGPLHALIMETVTDFLGVSIHPFRFSHITDENLKYLRNTAGW